ncbi:hypothetical protein BJ742DRAFT_778770 [Cladochytrium replicatum]|nr:hypothetical protein BJ742DRAFT_778770 [Cladochytrium replicatum]
MSTVMVAYHPHAVMVAYLPLTVILPNLLTETLKGLDYRKHQRFERLDLLGAPHGSSCRIRVVQTERARFANCGAVPLENGAEVTRYPGKQLPVFFHCLRLGGDWTAGFVNGLQKSRVIVYLPSQLSLDRMKEKLENNRVITSGSRLKKD